MKPINIGLLGIGTVGSGTFAVLKRNRKKLLDALAGKSLLKLLQTVILRKHEESPVIVH